MNVSIDIKTPAGQSLEGFPIEGNSAVQATYIQVKDDGETSIMRFISLWQNEQIISLHPGDTITITILP